MREWIVTNGLGGYASLTHTNKATSKYHGLLIASENPPTQRWVHLSNILTTIQTPTHNYKLNELKAKYTHLPTRSRSYLSNHTLHAKPPQHHTPQNRRANPSTHHNFSSTHHQQ